MRQFSTLLAILCLSLLSCTKKEVLGDELANARALHVGSWNFYQHEIETFNGSASAGKKLEAFSNYTVQWKEDGTYILNRSGSITTGTWELISPKLFVYDRNSGANERYFNIEKIENNFYTRKGPYKKDGTLYTTYLTTEYYKK